MYLSTENNFSSFHWWKKKEFMANQISVITEMAVCLMEAWTVALCKVNHLHSILFGIGFPVCLIRAEKHAMCSPWGVYLLSLLIVKIWEKVNMLIFYKQNIFK